MLWHVLLDEVRMQSRTVQFDRNYVVTQEEHPLFGADYIPQLFQEERFSCILVRVSTRLFCLKSVRSRLLLAHHPLSASQ